MLVPNPILCLIFITEELLQSLLKVWWYIYIYIYICTDIWNHLKWSNGNESIHLLAHGRCSWNLKSVIFKFIPIIDKLGISCEIAPRWMPQDLTVNQSSLVQVMAWCCWATSHYLTLMLRPISISFMSSVGFNELMLFICCKLMPKKTWML